MVIDWRAPVSLPFYRATRADPMGVELRRRFGFQHGTLTSFEDEDLTGARHRAPTTPRSSSRRSSGRASGRCATSSPPSSPSRTSSSAPTSSQSICVQGAPGTGKTAVGLHRAAYLLFAHREQLTRQGVLVVGPNASFLRYIRDVLPALGEVDATQSTIAELAEKALREVNPKWSVRGEEPADRRDAEGRRPAGRGACPCAVVPRDACRRRGSSCRAARGGGGWRRTRSRRCVTSLRNRGVRYGAARAMVPQALAHRSWCAWSWPATHPTTGCRTPSRAASRSRTTPRRHVAAGRPGAAGVAAAVGPRRSSPRRPSGLLSEEEQSLAAVGQAAEEPCVDAVDPRPRRSSSTRQPTSSSAGARSGTSWPTRRRTSRR